ncbi:MAG: hypothetical protein RLZZ626_794 [Actinomycetota bacterium]|jgi:hypothetical protein
MIRLPRWVISTVGLSFAVFQAVLGALWLDSYRDPFVGWLAIVLYLSAVVPTLVAYRGLTMPSLQAWFNLAVSMALPILINAQLADLAHETFETWYVGAIGVLLCVTAVRNRGNFSWLAASLVLGIMLYDGGPQIIATSGLIGMTLLVAAGQAVSVGLTRASRDIEQFVRSRVEQLSAVAATTAARAERTERLQQMFEEALPELRRISKAKGQLDERGRREARLLEAGMRDEIRGRNLLNDELRAAVKSARARGVEVTLLDDGGLDHLGSEARAALVKQAANAIAQLEVGKVTIRAPKNERWCLTVAGFRPGEAQPAIWLQLSH